MCYGIRAVQPEPGRAGAPAPSSGLERLRPRVVGAAGALLVAGFAAAAFITPLPPPGMNRPQVPAAPVPVAAQALEHTAAAVDDGVPTALDEARRSGGDCHHGL